jgi:hypothetical protein
MKNDDIDLLDYTIHWIARSESEFIGELFFVVKNKFGGSLSTPVGYIIGFIEPVSEYSPSHWKILMIIRDEIRYNLRDNITYVFIKSAYANKFKYYLQRLAELNHDVVRINPQLPIAIKESLTQKGYCHSPLAIQMITCKDKYVYSNVEFNFD